MRKKLITLGLVSTLLIGCGSTKPASDGCCEGSNRIAESEVTQNDRVTLGVLFSGMVLFVLHTATTR